jgi:DNA-binding MarR family transcriptional regulator
MSIEEDIQQVKFASEHQKVMINLLYTSSWANNIQNRFFKEYDLTPQQYNILRILRGQKGQGIQLSDISCRMIDKMSNTSRLVEKLRLKGLLERKNAEFDRRQVEVSITKKGEDLLSKIDTPVLEMHQRLNLSTKEAKTLNELLDKLRT